MEFTRGETPTYFVDFSTCEIDTTDVSRAVLVVKQLGVERDLTSGIVGDSVTEGVGNNTDNIVITPYPEVVESLIHPKKIYNLGHQGTAIAGTGESLGYTAFWTDSRINEIPEDTDIVFIMGGLNDSGTIADADMAYSNCNTNNIIGALANGSPTPVATVAEMTDESAVYLYTGSETGYTAGNWYYYDGSAWTSGGTYGGAVTSTTFNQHGVPADDFAVGEALADKADADDVTALDTRVTALESGSSGGLTAEIKAALLACFRGVAWKGDVDPDTLYGALDIALNPPVNLTSISAVYTQSGAVDVGASLDSLKADLVVTAHYSDSTSAVVTAYTLSGSLSDVGTNTITVSYGGKTTTFTVNVTSSWTYIWDLTDSLTDKVSGRVAVASAGSGVDAPAITSEGLVFNAETQRLSLGEIDLSDKTIEIDVVSMDFKGATGNHVRFLTNGKASGGTGYGPIIFRSGQRWAGYGISATSNSSKWGESWSNALSDRNAFNGKTVKLVNSTGNVRQLYLDGELIGTLNTLRYNNDDQSITQDVAIGGCATYSQTEGDQCYDMVISGIRIKNTEVAE